MKVKPDALAGDGLFGGIVGRDEDATVRDRLDPGDLWGAAVRGAWSKASGTQRSIGRARRWRPFNMSKHTLVAIRYSHDRTADRPSKRSKLRHARTRVSWTASSASNDDPSMR